MNDDTSHLGSFLFHCLFSKRPELRRIEFDDDDITDIINMSDYECCVERQREEGFALRSRYYGTGIVRYSVLKKNSRKFHAYVNTIMLWLKAPERATTVSEPRNGEIYYSAGTHEELLTAIQDVIRKLNTLHPDVECISWRFEGNRYRKTQVRIRDTKRDIGLPYNGKLPMLIYSDRFI